MGFPPIRTISTPASPAIYSTAVSGALLAGPARRTITGMAAPATAAGTVPSRLSGPSPSPSHPSLYTPPTAPARPPSGPVLPPSDPVTLVIPSIRVHTPLIQLGQAADGTADVPPREPGSPAGWYRYSPTPGSEGPSVILGHVNSTLTNVGVFYRLPVVRRERRRLCTFDSQPPQLNQGPVHPLTVCPVVVTIVKVGSKS